MIGNLIIFFLPFESENRYPQKIRKWKSIRNGGNI